jgi:FkbM family methyltransferase
MKPSPTPFQSNPPLVVHGVKVPIKEEEVSSVIWQALQSGEFEAKEAVIARDLLVPGDKVLELGTGLGVITSVLANTPDVLIWSFDANPNVVALARRVLEANDIRNVEVDQGIFTSGEPDTVTFFIRRDFWMSSLIEEQGLYESTIELDTENLDSFVSKRGINVLVMDIEGAEKSLLAGASLTSVDRIFLELHDHLYGLSGVRSIFNVLSELGFAYEPRISVGPCVLFQRDDGSVRPYVK